MRLDSAPLRFSGTPVFADESLCLTFQDEVKSDFEGRLENEITEPGVQLSVKFFWKHNWWEIGLNRKIDTLLV